MDDGGGRGDLALNACGGRKQIFSRGVKIFFNQKFCAEF
jgi:hypothetical protein